MDNLLPFITEITAKTIAAVISSLTHNWLPLSLAILVSAVMKVFINVEKLKEALLRKPKVSILASVAVGAFTPLCACGTMAVVVGMLTTALPWGPIMAFLTSSPLMSPDGFIMVAGIINLEFAIVLAAASIAIGLGSGYLTHIIEKRTDYLKNQTRFTENPQTQECACTADAPEAESCPCTTPASEAETCACTTPATCGCGSPTPAVETCGCGNPAPGASWKSGTKVKLVQIADALLNIGVKQILLYFSIFVAVGYLINYFVPTSYIMALFSPDSIFSVPLAALIGLPLYVTGDAAIPLIKSLMAGGAGDGAMLAFMITGPATSAWVIAGITAFMKRRVIGLYVGFILAGGIIMGYIYDFIIASGIF